MVRRMIQLLKTVIPMGWMLMIMLQNLPKVYIIFHIPEWGNYAFMCGKGYDICDWKIQGIGVEVPEVPYLLIRV